MPGGPILFWFALGCGITTMSMLSYFLQFAHERLKMDVIYNSILASIQIPAIFYAAFNYGVFGVAIAWFLVRLISFIIWIPIVHSKFALGIHRQWLLKDIAPIFFTTVALLLFIDGLSISFSDMQRVDVLVFLIGMGLIITMVNMLVSCASRTLILKYVRR